MVLLFHHPQMAAKLVPEEGATFLPLAFYLSSPLDFLEARLLLCLSWKGPIELEESDAQEEQHVLSLFLLHLACVVSVNVSSGSDYASSRCRQVSFPNDDSLPGKLRLGMNGSLRW